MPSDKRISELPAVTTPASDDSFPGVQSGANYRWSAAQLLRSPVDVYNVKHYGAVGDGLTDDSVAIQAALDAALAAGGGKVYLPASDYYIGSATLKYQSSGSLIIDGDAKYGASTIIANGSDIVLDCIASDRCVIRDITIETSGACGVGVLLARKVGDLTSSGFTFDNITIIGNFTKACIYNINSEVNLFIGCEIRNDEDNSFAFYMSTDNDLAVVSDGGVIAQFADGATNSIVNIIGGGIISNGTNGVSLGIFGGTRAINITDVYMFSTYRSVEVGPSIAVVTNPGPLVIKRCSFEGTFGKAIYIGDVTLYGLTIKENLTSINGAPAYSEVYQETVTPGRGISISEIFNNRHSAAVPMSFDRIFYSKVGDCNLQLRTLGIANEWINVQNLTYEAAATDQGSMRRGRIDTTERRIILGPMPTTASSDSATYSALQLRPSFSDKTPGVDDIGLITPWNGQYASQPNPGPIYDYNSHFRPTLTYWTGYEYLPITNPRKELFLKALPVSGGWVIGDMVWHLDAAIGEPAYWQCTTKGGAYLEVWAGGGAYVTGDRVLGSDNKVYEAIADGGEAEDPTVDVDHTYWQEEYATGAVFRAGPNL